MSTHSASRQLRPRTQRLPGSKRLSQESANGRTITSLQLCYYVFHPVYSLHPPLSPILLPPQSLVLALYISRRFLSLPHSLTSTLASSVSSSGIIYFMLSPFYTPLPESDLNWLSGLGRTRSFFRCVGFVILTPPPSPADRSPVLRIG